MFFTQLNAIVNDFFFNVAIDDDYRCVADRFFECRYLNSKNLDVAFVVVGGAAAADNGGGGCGVVVDYCCC